MQHGQKLEVVNHSQHVFNCTCLCDTRKVSEKQQMHGRVPTTPTAYMQNDQLTEPPMKNAHVQHVQGMLLLLSLLALKNRVVVTMLTVAGLAAHCKVPQT